MPDPIRHLGLLCIDCQEPFLRAIPERERLLQRTAFALEAAGLLGIAVAATEQLPEKLGPTAEALTSVWAANTPVFGKTSFSALEADGLSRWLETQQIDHLLLAGLETGICIYQTAVQAMGDELGVTLLSDCIAERRRADREPALRQLLAMDAHILPSETIVYSLLGGAEHPRFRDVTRLVKRYATPE